MADGTIIILNGASSSGKTTLLKVLQELFEEPYLDAGIDRFLWMLPGRYLNRPLWDEVLGLATEAGATGHRLMAGMHRAIAGLSRAGNNVLADHVLVEPGWVEDCAHLFADLPAYLIGIRCPLDVLEQRERDRRDRTLGQARAQFDLVHAHGIYDLEVDPSLAAPEACARMIKEHIASRTPPHAFRAIQKNEARLMAGRRQA